MMGMFSLDNVHPWLNCEFGFEFEGLVQDCLMIILLPITIYSYVVSLLKQNIIQ
jgi:hypothetical protein